MDRTRGVSATSLDGRPVSGGRHTAGLADRGQHGRDQTAPHLRQFRPPDIEQQHGAKFAAVVPGFMFDAVVEQHQFAFAPETAFIAHPERAASGSFRFSAAKPDAVVSPMSVLVMIPNVRSPFRLP
jgi:hypothetical protein